MRILIYKMASTKPLKNHLPKEKTKPQTTPNQRALIKLGLTRPIDFALHLPLRYEDETKVLQLIHAPLQEPVQIVVQVVHTQIIFQPRRQLLVTVEDGPTKCILRFLNFYPHHCKTFIENARLRIRGILRRGVHGLEMVHPSFRPADTPLPKKLTPIYPTIVGLSQAYLSKAIITQLGKADLSETVGQSLCPFLSISLSKALHFLHQPDPDTDLTPLATHQHPAWQRIKAEELLAQQLSQQQARKKRTYIQAPPLQTKETNFTQALKDLLPFQLTQAQIRVHQEITHDLAKHNPMHRLLQGDVGSGKTVIAALAAAQCIDAGWQCALMAPTEILAEQHFRKLSDWFLQIGVQVAWLSGSQKKKERIQVLANITDAKIPLVIGTHAVIARTTHFAKLGLTIIDEQHRFGVKQRLALKDKQSRAMSDITPHLLMMSATPIPRTLAMSYYADLEVSTLDELPPGRSPVLTKVISDTRKTEVIERMKIQVGRGHQVYWVCPLIEESEAIDLANATEVHAMLQNTLSQGSFTIEVGLLHSKMSLPEKQTVMQSFVKGHIKVLVCTTIIEVGVDVPNASLMVVEHAERFGLAQLHQLRGRVGRGAGLSACILLYSLGEGCRLGDHARQRLQAMRQSNDGFVIADHDLRIRGPGEFLGAKQSGHGLLRFAELPQDEALLHWAKQTAQWMLKHENDKAEKHVQRWLGSKRDYLGV
jgi:ATP-dependent DNA helicase RecG